MGEANRRWIRVDKTRCTGCRMCELACSFHYEKDCFDPGCSRIRIEKNEEEGVDAPNACRQCKKAKCAEVCDAKAITFDRRLGVWVVDEDKCTACGRCVEACPFNAIHLHPRTRMAIKCDLCRGEKPACLEACPTGAIYLPEEEKEGKRP